MRMLAIVTVCGVSSLLWAKAAEAAPPAWCKGAPVDTADLAKLSSTDIRDVLKTFVSAACTPTPQPDIMEGRAVNPVLLSRGLRAVDGFNDGRIAGVKVGIIVWPPCKPQ